MVYLGCHLTSAKGYEHMAKDAISIGADTLQFFTIPVGYLLGGALVDQVCEPFMATQPAGSPLTALFGTGKGSGAAFLFLLLAVSGILVCLLFRRNRHIRSLF